MKPIDTSSVAHADHCQRGKPQMVALDAFSTAVVLILS